jgi:DNA-directed RNA polymerase subunit H (RpoH/RPB5)
MDIDNVIKNLKEMLVARGDDISLFEEHEASVDRDEFENDKNIISFQTSRTTLIFALTKKLRKNSIDDLKDNDGSIEEYIKKHGNMKNIILIFNNDVISVPIMSQLNRYDKMFQKIGGQLQFFYTKQLMYNPTKHEYVPEHIKLTEEETACIMKSNMIRSKLYMPIILHNDPIAKWLGLKQGDVVKIIRYNENSGVSFYYRCCF